MNREIIETARSNSLGATLRRAAARHGDKVAIVCGDVAWSYREFDNLVDRLAAGLAKAGVIKGDRIAILARNSHAFMAVRFAAARIAAVLVPVNFMLNANDASYILANSGAQTLFVDPSTAQLGATAKTPDVRLFALPGEDTPAPVGEGIVSWEDLIEPAADRVDVASSGDLLQIIYTSGTESLPKGAMLTHDAVLAEYASCIVDCEWTSATVALHALPLFHCAQLDAMMGPAIQVGATNVITARPTPDNLIPLLEKYAINSFFCPPTVWISLLRSELFDKHDLSSLAKGYYGASIMPVEILRELTARLPGIRLWNLYGQTEIACVATVLFPEEHEARCGSAGRATFNVSTRVVDDEMNDVAPGETGEVVHRSTQLLSGYWGNTEATEKAFAGGWFHSGDLATIDEEGYLSIVDRKKDMIKTGGENVASREVEECLYTHPGVAEAAVFGVPHPYWIEAVAAVVVPKAGHLLTADEVIAHASARLAGFKTPKLVEIRLDLPRNASGKIMKRDLRQELSKSFA